MATTIQVSEMVKRELQSLKQSPRQTYEEVIHDLMELAREDRAELTEETKRGLRQAREDVRRGRVYTTRELIRDLGI